MRWQLFGKNMAIFKARFPIVDRVPWNGEADGDNLTYSAHSPSCTRPGKKRNRSSRLTCPIAKIKMIGRWVIEIYCPLGEAKAKNVGVKIDIVLRIARDGSDMMNAAKFHCSETNRFPITNSTHVFVATI